MKKLFLDCGTHFGQGLEEIGQRLNLDNQWIVHSWEANPYTFDQLDRSKYPTNYQFHNQAINTYYGTVSLNIETIIDGNIGQGTSIIEKEQWLNPMHKGTFTETIDVECIDLSQWLTENCAIDDYIVLKLDIEGAEYKVLDKMIEDQSIDLIDQLFIEWHARFFPNKEEYWDHQNRLIEVLRNKNIDIVRWG